VKVWPRASTWLTSSPQSGSSREDSLLLEVGRVIRPHGLRGEVVVELCTNRAERVEVGSRLVAERSGLIEVEASRPFGARWLVRFEGVASREAAELLRGERLLAQAIDEPGTLWAHELVGAEVEDVSGRRLGRVVALVANPASDLLELDGGALVPVRFVVEIGLSRVVVDVPAGLVD